MLMKMQSNWKSSLLVQMQNVTATLKNSLADFFYRFNTYLLYDPAIPCLGTQEK